MRCSTPCRRIGSWLAMAGCARSSSASARGAFVDVEADPSTPALAARLADEGVTLADGQRAEICLAVDGWVAAAAAGVGRGVLLLIDYGYPAAELYDPVRRRDGTLRAYLRHRVHDDPYLHVGRQDLTAHVDLTAVERAARAAGLGHLGHDHPGRVPRRARDRRAAGGHPGRSGHDDGGLPRGAFGTRPAPRPGGHGSVPGHGLRARLAGGGSTGGAGLSAGASTHHRPHLTAPDPTGLGRCTYCCAVRRRGTIRDGRARPDGEWRANLHARSARAAPRHLPGTSGSSPAPLPLIECP